MRRNALAKQGDLIAAERSDSPPSEERPTLPAPSPRSRLREIAASLPAPSPRSRLGKSRLRCQLPRHAHACGKSRLRCPLPRHDHACGKSRLRCQLPRHAHACGKSRLRCRRHHRQAPPAARRSHGQFSRSSRKATRRRDFRRAQGRLVDGPSISHDILYPATLRLRLIPGVRPSAYLWTKRARDPSDRPPRNAARVIDRKSATTPNAHPTVDVSRGHACLPAHLSGGATRAGAFGASSARAIKKIQAVSSRPPQMTPRLRTISRTTPPPLLWRQTSAPHRGQYPASPLSAN